MTDAPRRAAAISTRPLLALILSLSCAVATAAPVRTPHVEAELVAARTALEPGRPLTVALRLQMARGWHTYWRNPGDSGLPTRIEWKLPEGYVAGPIQWPAPARLPAGPLTNFGYEDEVLLLTDVQVPARATAPVTLAARAEWLVCNPERCIPEEAALTLDLPAGPTAPSRWAAAIERTRASLPAPAADHGPWRFAARGGPGQVELDVTPPPGVRLSGLAFFPYDDGKIHNSAAQSLRQVEGGYRLVVSAARQPVGEFTRMHGLLVAPQPLGSGPHRAVEIDAPIAGAVLPSVAAPRAPAPGSAGEPGLAAMLLFAFLGGLILNLMPCVLPVLSIKILGFAAHGGIGVRAMRVQGMLYAAGVVVSFLLLAGGLTALKYFGAALGWGFQLQSPLFVALLALLFFGIALNLSGAFEFGNLLPARLAGARPNHPYADAIGAGVLAVLVASPCTAPFMGAALGFALAASAGDTFLVFAVLGAGMAFPYLLLSWYPSWLSRLPRPGPWMVRLKQLLAFPLYATVIWLAWVLGQQSGPDAVIVLLAALLALGIAGWILGLPAAGRPAGVVAATVAAVTAVALGIHAASGVAGAGPARDRVAASGAWETWSRARLTALVNAGAPVFVDFTAAWCVTCQVNKQLVLTRGDVEDAFRRKGVTLLRADWTRRDPEITRALAELGRNGVPVYVLYRRDGQARVLPEILTREAVLAALAEVDVVSNAGY